MICITDTWREVSLLPTAAAFRGPRSLSTNIATTQTSGQISGDRCWNQVWTEFLISKLESWVHARQVDFLILIKQEGGGGGGVSSCAGNCKTRSMEHAVELSATAEGTTEDWIGFLGCNGLPQAQSGFNEQISDQTTANLLTVKSLFPELSLQTENHY